MAALSDRFTFWAIQGIVAVVALFVGFTRASAGSDVYQRIYSLV